MSMSEALQIIDGPDEPQGRRNNVMGVHTRYPGLGFQVQALDLGARLRRLAS